MRPGRLPALDSTGSRSYRLQIRIKSFRNGLPKAVRAFLKLILILCTLTLGVTASGVAVAHNGEHHPRKMMSHTKAEAQKAHLTAIKIVKPAPHVVVRAFVASPLADNDCFEGDCLCHKDRLSGSCCAAFMQPGDPKHALPAFCFVEGVRSLHQIRADVNRLDVPIRPPIRMV